MSERTLPLVSKLSVEETLRREYNNGEYEIVLDMAFTGQEHTTSSGYDEKILFLLIETVKEDEGYPRNVGDVSVCTIYYSVRGNEIAYRAYGEESGPFARSCPIKFLQQLTPTTNEQALEWRAECWQFWQKYAEWVAPRWKDTPGKMQDLFLAMYLSKANTVVCFHQGKMYRIEWFGEVPQYSEKGKRISLECSFVHRSGIYTDPEGFKTSVAMLADVIYLLDAPISHGWIALDYIYED